MHAKPHPSCAAMLKRALRALEGVDDLKLVDDLYAWLSRHQSYTGGRDTSGADARAGQGAGCQKLARCQRIAAAASKFYQSQAESKVFSYDADGERLETFRCPANVCGEGEGNERFALRGLNGEVLRIYEGETGNRRWVEDYVYANGQPLARVRKQAGGETFEYLHLDHLGSVRKVTDELGAEVAKHEFYPFGEETTAPSGDDTKLKFTGHERDDGSGSADELDYMHARFCGPRLGRFLSMDPIPGERGLPQSWNSYSYARNNPIAFLDPTGMYTIDCGSSSAEECEANSAAFEEARQENLTSDNQEIQATAEAYGDPGDDNGIVVSFDAGDSQTAAHVVADIEYDQDNGGFHLTVDVTVDPNLTGERLRSAVGHEGQHILDAQAFFSTFTPTGNFTYSMNLTVPQTERNAYRITLLILAETNTPRNFRGARNTVVELGRLMSDRKRDSLIEQILEGPIYAGRNSERLIRRYE